MQFLISALRAGDQNDKDEAIAQCLCGTATLSDKDSISAMVFTSLIDSYSSNVKNIRTMPESKVLSFAPLPNLAPKPPQTPIFQQTSNNNNNNHSSNISSNSNNKIIDDGPESRLTSGSKRFKSKNIEPSETPSFQTAASALGAIKKNKLSKSQNNNGNNTTNTNNNNSKQTKEGEFEGDERLRGIDPQIIEKIENEILLSQNDVRWEEVAGLAAAKQAVIEAVIFPMKHPEIFTGLRAPPRGVLFFGPPGTGKTMIAQALAHESKCTFFNISASSLTSKWVGEGEKLTRALFCVARVREPSIVFIDEIDSLLTKRSDNDFEASRRVKTEFLLQFQGVASGNEKILILGATNRPQDLDEAARRRFEKRIYIPLPDEETRRALVLILLKKEEMCEFSEEQVNIVVEKTDGYSCADITTLFREASFIAIREKISILRMEEIEAKPIIRSMSYEDIEKALKMVRPSVSPDSLAELKKWNEDFGYTAGIT